MTSGRGNRLHHWLRRHQWEPHPAFSSVSVRRCIVCGRVEHKAFMALDWTHAAHLDNRPLPLMESKGATPDA